MHDIMSFQNQFYKFLDIIKKYEVYFKFLVLLIIVFSVVLFVRWNNIPFDVTKPELFAEWAQNQGPNFAITVFIINLLVIVVPFLPNDPIHMAAGLVMPWWQAFLLIHSCSLIGWSINYYLGNKLGADFVNHMIGEENSKKLSKLINNTSAKHLIFLAWTPGVSYDIIGYISGVSNIRFRNFFIGALVGTVPTTLLSIFYGVLTQRFWWVTPFMLAINIIAFLGLSSFILYKFNKKPTD